MSVRPAESDLTIRAVGLLDFVLQSVADGLKGGIDADECFREADNALSILKRTLFKEDQHRMTELALMGVLDTSFVRILSNEDQHERDKYLNEALEKIAFAKTRFL